jgi:hypothetical protein
MPMFTATLQCTAVHTLPLLDESHHVTFCAVTLCDMSCCLWPPATNTSPWMTPTVAAVQRCMYCADAAACEVFYTCELLDTCNVPAGLDRGAGFFRLLLHELLRLHHCSSRTQLPSASHLLARALRKARCREDLVLLLHSSSTMVNWRMNW